MARRQQPAGIVQAPVAARAARPERRPRPRAPPDLRSTQDRSSAGQEGDGTRLGPEPSLAQPVADRWFSRREPAGKPGLADDPDAMRACGPGVTKQGKHRARPLPRVSGFGAAPAEGARALPPHPPGARAAARPPRPVRGRRSRRWRASAVRDRSRSSSLPMSRSRRACSPARSITPATGMAKVASSTTTTSDCAGGGPLAEVDLADAGEPADGIAVTFEPAQRVAARRPAGAGSAGRRAGR